MRLATASTATSLDTDQGGLLSPPPASGFRRRRRGHVEFSAGVGLDGRKDGRVMRSMTTVMIRARSGRRYSTRARQPDEAVGAVVRAVGVIAGCRPVTG